MGGYLLDSHVLLWLLAAAAGLRELPVTAAHAESAARVSLPHRDPFDRILVAQAASERLALLTVDRMLLGAGLDHVRDARV